MLNLPTCLTPVPFFRFSRDCRTSTVLALYPVFLLHKTWNCQSLVFRRVYQLFGTCDRIFLLVAYILQLVCLYIGNG